MALESMPPVQPPQPPPHLPIHLPMHTHTPWRASEVGVGNAIRIIRSQRTINQFMICDNNHILCKDHLHMSLGGREGGREGKKREKEGEGGW